MLARRIFLLSIFSSTLLFFLFFSSYNVSSKMSVDVGPDQQHIITPNILETKSYQNNTKIYSFSKYQYLNISRKPHENAIAFLVASFTGNQRLAFNPYPKLRERIIQLDERLGDNYTTDILIFHTGYPFQSEIRSIIEATHRQVEFINVDHIFYKFPPDFDPHLTDPTWSQRGKWNYHHMCNFWFKQIFELKLIYRYRYLMRLDDDSQISGKWPNVFDLMIQHKALYMANSRSTDFDHILPGMTRVRNVTIEHVNKNNITIQNPLLYADLFKKPSEIPNYWNNFEIIDLSFIRRREVIDFTEAIDKSKGIFLYRWGDAPLRFITLALFVKPDEILHREKLGLDYCHPC